MWSTDSIEFSIVTRRQANESREHSTNPLFKQSQSKRVRTKTKTNASRSARDGKYRTHDFDFEFHVCVPMTEWELEWTKKE